MEGDQALSDASDKSASAGGPEPPDELWAVRFGDGSIGGNNDLWYSVARDPTVAGFAARMQHADPVLIGVHPRWRARAEAAEAEVDRLRFHLDALYEYGVRSFGHEAVADFRRAAGLGG